MALLCWVESVEAYSRAFGWGCGTRLLRGTYVGVGLYLRLRREPSMLDLVE